MCSTVTNEKCTYFERLCRMSPFVGIENSEQKKIIKFSRPNGLVAQWLAHWTSNSKVVGSNPIKVTFRTNVRTRSVGRHETNVIT